MTQTVLHVTASARRTASGSRALSDKLIAALAPTQTLHRDVATQLPLVDANWVTATFTPKADRTAEMRDTLSLSDSLVDELRTADTLVIATPIYNFGVPAGLKAWIDQIARLGETFRYTETGPQGLLADKKVYLVITSGGTPVGSEIDFATGYLQHVMGFVGLTDVTVVTQATADEVIAGLAPSIAAA